MNSVEHKEEAEIRIGMALVCHHQSLIASDESAPDLHRDARDFYLALAQVHATLSRNIP